MYRFHRQHLGPIQAVVFDWAGTIVDFGSFAPIQVLIDAFKGFGVAVEFAEARIPMGMPKREHIRALSRMPAVAARWREAHGRELTDGDGDEIYKRFIPLQVEKVADHSQVIPGVLDTLAWLRERGIRTGSSTGYPREVMNRLIPYAERQGLCLDCNLAGDDLEPGGRPGPWMALASVIRLGVTDVAACVKVDDTEPGIAEGLNAGMWTVGVTLSGNETGLTQAELEALPAARRLELRDRAAQRLLSWGAHDVVDTVADLPAALTRLQALMAAGARP